MKFGLQQKYIDLVNGVFTKHPAVKEAIIFGSRAMGTFRPSSDIDLTLIGDDLSFSEFLLIENELDDLLIPYKMDLSQKKNISNASLNEHISRVGSVFYNAQ